MEKWTLKAIIGIILIIISLIVVLFVSSDFWPVWFLLPFAGYLLGDGLKETEKK